MIRNIFSKLLLPCSIAAVLATSCRKEYEPLDKVSDLAWYTSETINQGNSEYVVNVDTFISFIDASQGFTSHKWVIEEGSNFMIDDFDYKKPPIKNQVDPNKGLVSKNAAESIFFGTPGKTTVTLVDTFNEWATSHEKNPTQTVLEDGIWVLRKVFTVNVYAKPRPAFTVKKSDGTVLLNVLPDDVVSSDKSTWKNVEVEAGESLTFVNNTPNQEFETVEGITWSVEGSVQKTSAANEAAFTFNVPSEEGYSEHSLAARRVEKPVANVKKSIPLVIKVVKSSKPFEVDTKSGMSTVDIRTINIKISSGALASIATDEKLRSSFTVKCGSEIIPVSSVTADANGTKLKISLSAPLSEGALVKVYYDGTGGIESMDGRSLEGFEISVPNTVTSNLIPKSVSGFEVGGTTPRENGWMVDNKNTGASAVVTADPVNTTNKALKIVSGTANDKYVSFQLANLLDIDGGKFKVSLMVYTDQAINDAQIKVQKNGANPLEKISDLNVTSTGTWTKITSEFDTGTDKVTNLQLFFPAGKLPVNSKIYFDDIKLEYVN